MDKKRVRAAAERAAKLGRQTQELKARSEMVRTDARNTRRATKTAVAISKALRRLRAR